MKKALSIFFEFTELLIGKVIGVVYGYRVKQRVRMFCSRVFTNSVASQFKKFGKGVNIAPSVTLRGPQYVSIGDFSTIWERSAITAWGRYRDDEYTPSIVIGENTSIGSDCHITAINKIELGDGVLLGKKVTITDNSHGICTADQLEIAPNKRPLISKGPVIIEDNVWIGEKATILPGVRIGRGAIVAANAVVTKDVPEGCVVAGVPARVIENMLES